MNQQQAMAWTFTQEASTSKAARVRIDGRRIRGGIYEARFSSAQPFLAADVTRPSESLVNLEGAEGRKGGDREQQNVDDSCFGPVFSRLAIMAQKFSWG